MKYVDQFKAAAKRAFAAEYPGYMRTMRFTEDVTVPYTETTRRSTTFVGYSGSARCYEVKEYNPPKVVDKTYDAEKLSWVEAEKVHTADGPRYRLSEMTKVIPGLNAWADIKRKSIITAEGRGLVTKNEALAELAVYDKLYAAGKNIKRDGAHTRQYFGVYLPKDEKGNIYTPKRHGIFKI